MRTYLIIFLIGLMLTGCGRSLPVNGKEMIMTNDARLFSQNKLISAKAPDSLQPPFVGYFRFDKELLNFERTIPNMMKEDVTIRVDPLDQKYLLENRLLEKKFNKEFEEYFAILPLTEWKMDNHLERGVNYYKNYVDFIGGLKCGINVESQNMANGIGSKKYWAFCPYYDKQGNKKYLGIDHRFYYTFNQTKFEGSDSPSLVRHKLKEIELQFKKDMKEIFDSIEVYDMDRERMQKEGLLYDEKYSLDNESKAKDKSMKCTFIKESDSWACKGRETDRKCTKKRVEHKWKCEEKK